MKHALEVLVKIALFAVTLFLWVWARNRPPSTTVDLLLIVGGMVFVFPVMWVARKVLDSRPTTGRAAWTTAFVHFTLMLLLGVAIIRAVVTHRDWVGWTLPIPARVGRFLMVITGAAALLTVVNLAWKGLGAPFAIALSRRLTTDWCYRWTRNPMVLATLAFLLALGVWCQSALLVLWVLLLVTPAWLWFLKVYEERELEIRFGTTYLEYKSRTPMLLPRGPRR
jgi:protein-S-isoprenylcysteine O-methyltransferase Ste14